MGQKNDMLKKIPHHRRSPRTNSSLLVEIQCRSELHVYKMTTVQKLKILPQKELYSKMETSTQVLLHPLILMDRGQITQPSMH